MIIIIVLFINSILTDIDYELVIILDIYVLSMPSRLIAAH